MNTRPKRVPRLWCARLGLLPFDVVFPASAASASAMRSPPVIAASPVVPLGPEQPGGAAIKLKPNSD